MVCQAWLVDKYDKHNRLWNTAKAYNPKIAEFKLYCKTFYNNNTIVTYQVTRGKVELFLTYNFFCEAKLRERERVYQGELPNWTTRGQTNYVSVPICKGKANKVVWYSADAIVLLCCIATDQMTDQPTNSTCSEQTTKSTQRNWGLSICSILFYSFLFYSILFYSILFFSFLFFKFLTTDSPCQK